MDPKYMIYWTLSITLFLIPLISYFAQPSRLSFLNIFQNYELKRSQNLTTIAPYLGYNGTAPKEWFDKDGIPLFYEAWRVKPGDQTSEPTKRSSLLPHGSHVACWPSTGGVWTKFAQGPDLDFLNLPRYNDVERTWPHDAEAEDAICQRMRLVGSSFYGLPPAITQFNCGILEECVQPTSAKESLGFAWNEFESLAILNLTSTREKYGSGLHGWNNARDMEERYWRLSEEEARCNWNPEGCRALWCIMYPDYCYETAILPLFPKGPDI